ncbi:hypothetical protein FALBO_10519 [Fusarium albosuccineum]|uniref:Uncharacterized protein n=1 Tax=Fusarium albosuccineum TaxID=1237068 RepID=A0A8H4P4Z5_9HYPO|nr:hypothetical protein FALBO_10519 [Fusarium albosuccineum]
MSIIQSPRLDRLWQEAQIYPEWATTRLWEYIFNHVIFKDDKWIVSSQQPPTHQDGDLRRVDLVVERMDNNAVTVSTLLFMEAKRASASVTDLEEVEYQAFTAACAYSIESSKNYIWAMTVFGGKARLWIFNIESTYLIPFVPQGIELAERSEYLEIATDGQPILEGLDYIKRHPTPPQHLLQQEPSPRPANTRLPPGWHDTEVTQLDTHYNRGNAPSLDQPTASGMGAWEHSDSSAPPNIQPAGFSGPESGTSGWVPNEELPASFDAPQSSTSGWVPNEEPPGALDQVDPGEFSYGVSSQAPKDKKKEVEVKVTRDRSLIPPFHVHYNFLNRKKEEVETKGDDWIRATREGRSVWVYKHGKKTTYWTKKLD